MKIKTKYIYIFSSVLILLMLLLGVVFIFVWPQKELPVGTNSAISASQYPRNLDGVMAAAPDLTNLKPLAIIIDNHADSRPVYGLDQASVVYEAIVESDITRYLAIFDQSVNIAKIGPVRSARPYLVEWAQQFNPVFYHSGGSPQALDLLKESLMRNINEISGDGIYFWRDEQRLAPHNLFTSAKLLQQSLADKKIDLTVDFIPWQFKDDLAKELRPKTISDININFSRPEYQVAYRYDNFTNSYQRALNNKPHQTAGANQIWAKNVVVMSSKAKVIDRLGRLKVDTSSGGSAIIYQDGQEIPGTWRSQADRIIFYNDKQEEIKFNRGSIWIEVLFRERPEDTGEMQPY